MAIGDTYTDAGAGKVSALLASQTWWVQTGIGETLPTKSDTAMADVTGCPGRVQAVVSQPQPDTLAITAIVAYPGALSVTELGVFDAEVGGVLFQHHGFVAIAVVGGTALEFTVTHRQG